MPSTRSKRNDARPDVEIKNMETKPKKGRPKTKKGAKKSTHAEELEGKLQ